MAPVKVNLLSGGARELVMFLREIVRAVLTEQRAIQVDFRRTESFAPAGTLLLFAEIDRVVTLSKLSKPITCRPPYRRRPREVLKQIGLFKVTSDSVDVTPEREDVVFWKATKGFDQSGESFGPLLEHVAERVDKRTTDHIAAGDLWPGVSEAVMNTVDHAYLDDRGDGHAHSDKTRWWMFTHLRDGLFTVAVCDLGIGYQRSTPKNIPADFLEAVFAAAKGENRDVMAIQAAMKYGVSGTKQEHRGKGSRDAMALLKQHGHGQLMILSGSGVVDYTLRKGQAEPKIERQIDLGVQTRSTIVWWRLPVGGG